MDFQNTIQNRTTAEWWVVGGRWQRGVQYVQSLDGESTPLKFHFRLRTPPNKLPNIAACRGLWKDGSGVNGWDDSQIEVVPW